MSDVTSEKGIMSLNNNKKKITAKMMKAFSKPVKNLLHNMHDKSNLPHNFAGT